MEPMGSARVAVVIPSFRVVKHILSVLQSMPPEIERIYVVDDACPAGSGDHVEAHCRDPRVKVLRHAVNQGVGGAVMTGYRAAVADGCDVIVKVDGDGQMDPALIGEFVRPILMGEADYTKGNRFFDLERIRTMPAVRLFGNATLSFLAKLSSGYWDLFDPTNGFTAIHAGVARHLPYDKISSRYFFETDLLFRLNTLRAVVVDIPMDASYGDEVSNLKVSRIIGEFLIKHIRNAFLRIVYNYYLRDLSLASLELPVGLALFGFGVTFGAWHWLDAVQRAMPTPIGTVMVAALPTFIGLQLILAFLAFDIAAVPRRPVHRRLPAAPGLEER